MQLTNEIICPTKDLVQQTLFINPSLYELPSELHLNILLYLSIPDISAVCLSCKKIIPLQKAAFYACSLDGLVSNMVENYNDSVNYLKSLITKISNENMHAEFNEFHSELLIEIKDLKLHLQSDTINYLKSFTRNSRTIPLSVERARFNRKLISIFHKLSQFGISLDDHCPFSLEMLINPLPIIDNSNTLFISRSGLRKIGRPPTESLDKIFKQEKEKKESLDRIFKTHTTPKFNDNIKDTLGGFEFNISCGLLKNENFNLENNVQTIPLNFKKIMKLTSPSGGDGDGSDSSESSEDEDYNNIPNPAPVSAAASIQSLQDDENECFDRLLCLALTILTPFVHPLLLIGNIAYRALKLITLSHFWVDNEVQLTGYQFKARLENAKIDLFRIVCSPLALIGYELSAIYGMYRPKEGFSAYKKIFDFVHAR